MVPTCLALAAACSSGGNHDTPPLSNTGKPQTLVVVGTGNALGDTLDDPLRDDWPRLAYLKSFPQTAAVVDRGRAQCNRCEP